MAFALWLTASFAGALNEPVDLLDPKDLSAFRSSSVTTGNSTLDLRVEPVVGQSFDQKIRVKSLVETDPHYRAGFKSPRARFEIKKGDTVLLSYWIRCQNSSSTTGKGRFEGYFESPGPPWEMAGRFNASVGANWERRFHSFVAEKDWAKDTLQLAFHLGQYRQELEFGGFSWQNLGPNILPTQVPRTVLDYDGRKLDAPWRKAAEQRIDRIRKAPIQIRVVDEKGRPVKDATIQVRMKRHAYGFGTFIDTAALRTDADGERYRKELLRQFNLVTVGFFWVDWWWDTESNRPGLLQLARWSKSKGLRLRGNNLLIPGWRWSPAWLRRFEKEPAILSRIIGASIAERAALFREFKLEESDSYAEPRANREFIDMFGYEKMFEWLRMAKSLNPSPRWAINEDTILEHRAHTERNQDQLEAEIKRFQAAKAPIGAIGLEGRFDEELTPPTDILRILDRFAKLNLPITQTELSLNIADEAVQAEYMRDFMTAFFSHPSTHAIVNWGFWEGQHWIPYASFFRKDWSEKPVLSAYRELVFKRWWSNADGKTNSEGKFSTRGFLGNYELTVSRIRGPHTSTTLQKIALTRNGANLTIRLTTQ